MLDFNQKFLDFVENLEEGIWMIDQNAKTIYANSYIANMLGYTKHEMLGKHLFYFMDAPAVESAKKYLRRRAEGIIENHDFEFTCKTGEKVLTNLNTYPLLDRDGIYNGSIAAITNLTERKKLEEIAHQLEVKFKAVFDYASIGLAILNNDLQIIDANKKMCDNLQYSKAELLNISIEEIVSPEYKDEVLRNKEGLVKGTSSAFQTEYKFIRKDGSFGWGITNFFIVKEDQSLLTQIIFTLRDITEKKNLEHEIFNREAIFKSVFEYSSAAIIVFDRELRNLYVNPVAFDIVGRKREAVLNKRHMSEGLPNLPDFYQKWEKRVLDAFSSGKSNQFADVDQIGGKCINSESSTMPIRDQEDNVFAVAVIFRDVTKRKQLEKEIIENEKFAAMGQTAAHLSHEIRAPLASISMNMDLLSKSLKLNNTEFKSFKLINEEIERLTELVQNILDFSREFYLHKINFDIRETLNKVCTLLKPNFKEKAIEFENKVESQLIIGDADKIEAVLIDVIKNSIEAIDKKGKIKIYSHSKAAENIFELFIEDSGRGVDNVLKIFDPFYTTKTRGTGLGLSIAKIIIEKHGGTIQLVSSRPGLTIFQINLPINEKANE